MANLISRAAGFDDVPTSYHVRISEEYFVGFIGAFLTIALLSAVIRTALRVHHYKTIAADDYILLFACCCLGATAGVAWTIKDLVYLQIYVGLGWQAPAADFFERMLIFEQRVVVCSILSWAAIYAVKLSFLIFFKRLVHRVRSLEIHWWVCLCFAVAGACASLPLVFLICPHFGDDYMAYCPIASQIHGEVVYLQTSVAIDVLTDVLIVSIPVRLLWKLQMPLKKKLVIGTMLSLSVFMIAIAIVRTTMAPLPNGVLDTSWVVFWQGMEAVVAVLMVSLTAVRGLFGPDGRNKRSKETPGSGGPLVGKDRMLVAGDQSGTKSSKKPRSIYDEENIRLTGLSPSNSTRRETLWDVEQGTKTMI